MDARAPWRSSFAPQGAAIWGGKHLERDLGAAPISPGPGRAALSGQVARNSSGRTQHELAPATNTQRLVVFVCARGGFGRLGDLAGAKLARAASLAWPLIGAGRAKFQQSKVVAGGRATRARPADRIDLLGPWRWARCLASGGRPNYNRSAAPNYSWGARAPRWAPHLANELGIGRATSGRPLGARSFLIHLPRPTWPLAVRAPSSKN